MKSFNLIATATIVLVATVGMTNAGCSCQASDYDCLSKCVDTTHSCLSSCKDNDCYSSCIGQNWPGAIDEQNQSVGASADPTQSASENPTASSLTATTTTESVDVSASPTSVVSNTVSSASESISDISASVPVSASSSLASNSVSNSLASVSSFSAPSSLPSSSLLPSALSSSSIHPPQASQTAPSSFGVTNMVSKEWIAIAITMVLVTMGNI